MKRFILIVTLALIFTSCTENKTKDGTVTTSLDSNATSSGDTSSTSSSGANSSYTPVDTATANRNWMAYATPGDMHAMMAKWNGTWTGKMLMWMAPGAPADTSTATAVNKMIYDNRYQVSTHKGNVMGMNFEGQSIMGYDNFKKVFQSTWMDNMGTGVMIMEGPYDAATKTITMTGKMVDATRGDGSTLNMRHVVRIVDDNNHVFEMYCNGPDGKEFKTMEISMTRK